MKLQAIPSLYWYNKEETEESASEEEQWINQEICNTPIDPTLRNSPLVVQTSLPDMTSYTRGRSGTGTQVVTERWSLSPRPQALSPAPPAPAAPAQTAAERTMAALCTALHRTNIGGCGGGGGGGSGGGRGGRGGSSGRGGRGIPAQNPNQVIQLANDIWAMGSLPPAFDGDHSKADKFLLRIRNYLALN